MTQAAPIPLERPAAGGAHPMSNRLTQYQRNLARWRGEHLQRAAHDLHTGRLAWRGTYLPTHDNYDGRTNEKPTGGFPRGVYLPSHTKVTIPSVRTPHGLIGHHTLTLTPNHLRACEQRMRQHGVLGAWLEYLDESLPIQVYAEDPTAGIRTTKSAAPGVRPGIRTAVLILALPYLERETGDTYTPDDATPTTGRPATP